jgi:hypothetical protein
MIKKEMQKACNLHGKGWRLRSEKKFWKRQQSKARRRYAKANDTINGFEQKVTASWKII